MAFSCRLCLEKYSQDKLKNVFQCNIQHAEDSLVNILFWIFSVEIDVTDQFSKEICCECFQLIEYILQARRSFQINQTRLRNYLQSQCNNLEDQSVCETNLKKIPNPSSPSRSATNSLNRSRYTLNNLYGSCSPRVRVSLSTIEAMCPVSVNIVPVENTQEYLRYKQLKNGRFKKRKYRHFNMDDSLLNEICSSLDRTQLDVSTENLLISRGANTYDIDTYTHENYVTSSQSLSNKAKEHFSTVNENTHEEESFLESVGITSKLDSLLASPEGNQEYDWTSLTFKKDASVNTESDKPNTRDVGISAVVQTVTTGSLTKNFKQMKKKDVVRVNIKSLENFGPNVLIEPLENILKVENYKQVDEFRFVKTNSPDNDEENSDSSEDSQETQSVEITSKKQKFLDYYKNFSSFAVRELITGKKIRDNETSSVFRLDHCRNVFVCEFCSRSFLTRISLNVHCRKRHKTMGKDNLIIDLVDNVNSTTSVRKANIGRRTGGISSSYMYVKSQKGSNTEQKDESLETEVVNEHFLKPTEQACDSRTTGLRKRSHSILYNDDIKSGICPNQVPVKTKRKRRKHKMTVQKKIVSKASNTAANISNDHTSDEHHNIDDATKIATVEERSCDNIKNKIKIHRKVVNSKNLTNKDKNSTSYVWNRKSLGKYSAISYYQNNLKNDNKIPIKLELCEPKEKKDHTLNETIQKLVTRLDNSNSEESYNADFFS